MEVYIKCCMTVVFTDYSPKDTRMSLIDLSIAVKINGSQILERCAIIFHPRNAVGLYVSGVVFK